jgi:polysaccharide biosynthesis transport protein
MTTTTSVTEFIGNESPAIGGGVNTGWPLYLDRIRRRKWLVLGLGVVAAAITYGIGVTQPTTYTVYATLSTATANRAPEQDGVLASGYVDYFNSDGYQSKLKAGESFPGDVTLHARTAAASPIIYVEVTSESRATAEAAAPKAAAVFSDEINSHLRAAQDATIADVRKPFDDVRLANGIVSEVSLEQLQDRINQITGDSTNKLTSLQMESGVSVSSPSAWPGALLALLGGLIVGCVLALVAGALSRRLPGGAELAAKTGLEPIVELPAPNSTSTRRLRDYRVQQLVNAVAFADLPAQATVVVTSTVATAATARIARELAEGRAAQGVSTVLVDGDLRQPGGVGFGNLMSDDNMDIDSVVVATSDSNLVEIKCGRATEAPFVAVTAARALALFSRLRERADFVVVIAPPITEAAEAQVLCAVADGVLLVVDAQSSRVHDATEAAGILRSFKARLLGTVMTDARSTPGFFSRLAHRGGSDAATVMPATSVGSGAGVASHRRAGSGSDLMPVGVSRT